MRRKMAFLPKIEIDFKKLLLFNWQYLALIAILLFAFYVRYVPYTTNKYVNLDDPYYLYKMTDYYVTHGSLPAVDYQSYYPVGRPLPLYADQAFLYILVGWMKIIGSFFFKGLTTYQTVFLYPAIMGALQVIPMFLLVSALSKSKTAGLISAAFYGVVPAALSRTFAGFGYKEGFGMFFLLFSLYFLVHAIERKNHVFSALSGAFLFLMGLTWGGVQIGQLLLLLYAFCALVLELKKPVASASIIACIVSIALGFVPAPHTLQLTIAVLALMVLAMVLVKKYAHPRFGVIHIAIIFVVLYFVFPAKVSQLIGFAVNFNIGATDAGLASTIAQNKLTSWDDFMGQMGLTALSGLWPGFKYFSVFLISMVGALYIVYEFVLKDKKVDELKLFMLVFFLYGLWFGRGAVRLITGTAVSVSIVAGYFLWKVVSKDRKVLGLNLRGWYFVPIIAVSLLAQAYVANAYATGTRTTMNDQWQEGLTWLKDHSPSDSVVFSWWDYGYIIQVIANRTSVVDPRNLFTLRNIEAASFLTAPSENASLHFDRDGWKLDFPTALDYLRHYNITYIVLDAGMIWKYSAVSKIAANGDKIDQYIVYPFQGTECSDAACSERLAHFGPLTVVQRNDSSVAAFLSQQGAGRLDIPRTCDVPGDSPCVLIGQNAAVIAATCNGQGCVLSKEPTDSLFFKMWFQDSAGLEHIRLVHQNSFVKVYQVI